MCDYDFRCHLCFRPNLIWMAQPSWNRRKKMVPFLLPLLQFHGVKGISKTGIRTLQTQGNAHGSNNSCDDVRTLCKQGRLQEALHILHVMDQSIEFSTYLCLLQGCIKKKSLPEGKLVHAHMNDMGFMPDRFLRNTLVNMYIKCGNLMDARRVFDQMPERDVFSWTVMIAACNRHGLAEEALTLFYQMQRSDIQSNQFTFASVLPACASLAVMEQGVNIHEEIIRTGFQSDIFVANALVDMYAKCGNMKNARNVFDKMPKRDVVSWTTMITGYAQNRDIDEALKLFQEMPERNVVSWTAMIAGYAQNGHGEEALKLFEKMPRRDVASWNAIIAGHAQTGHGDEALNLFRQMKLAGTMPNSKTFASVLPACASLAALEQGMEIHEEIIKSGFQSDMFVANALVDMYAKCGSMEKARDLFEKMHQRDTVSWTAMIAGYTNSGHVDEALKLFQKIPQPDMFSWTAMIAGYAQNGHGEEALELFRRMQLAGVKSDSKTFVIVLQVCANLAALEQGMEVHKEIVRNGFQSNVIVANSLTDMYAKCGSIENARNVFDKIQQRDVATWNAIIAGYAMHGYGKEALDLFEQMEHSSMHPNHVTLVCVLSACCHAGLVDAGWQYFDCMSQHYHITPAMEHYGCMVDLLGRAGRLDEAQDFINKMPITPDATVWRSLLGACRIHNNIELGECVADHLFELEPKNASSYVLLSNMYAAADRWDDIEKVRKMMKDRRVIKIPGCSWIEVNNKVHAFLVGDRSHPQTQQIYAKLEKLSRQMKVAGYVPDMRFVLNNVEEEQKEQILCYHSEKLAIAFGLINTSPGKAIRVIKNLRVCGDCHSASKFISKIVAREIVVRDANRYHHFKNGLCSCGDYW
eukprot:Gb_27463 [translate_table: standard]